MSKHLPNDIISSFIAYCIDPQRAIPDGIEQMDWEAMYEYALEQAIVGVVFQGLQRLPKERRNIRQETLLQFFGDSEAIRERNKEMFRYTTKVWKRLGKDGWQSCILKGQGNALMYPDSYSRMPGDIDVWVKGARKDIIAYARKYEPAAEVRVYHVDFPVLRNADIELHYTPAICNSWLHRHRMKRWFAKQQEQQCQNAVDLPDGVGQAAVPTVAFNLVYQMAHMMHHFFDEGIGLRQMMDYYYLLKSADRCTKDEVFDTLRYLGLLKFAGAVMYVEREALDLDDKYLIVPVDTHRGETLLAEILKGGNFGQHSGLTNHNTGTKYFIKIARNLHFVSQYPAEALSEPLFRTWHFFWRLFHRCIHYRIKIVKHESTHRPYQVLVLHSQGKDNQPR